MVKIGDAVVYVDERARERLALVTAVWGSAYPAYTPNTPAPGVNLVLVHEDPARDDTYGRQIERETSQVHQTNQPAHSRYWRGLTEPDKGTGRAFLNPVA